MDFGMSDEKCVEPRYVRVICACAPLVVREDSGKRYGLVRFELGIEN